MTDLMQVPMPAVHADPARMTAVDAARGLDAWAATRQQLVQVTDVQIMLHAAAIRREYCERDAFDAFCREHVAALTPERVWLLAQTWEAAQKNRNMRELARTSPGEAVALVADFAEAGLEERLANLDEDDRELLRALSGPPKQMRQRLRQLVDAERCAAAGRNPADVRRIEALTEERDAAVAALADSEKVRELPTAAINEVIVDLQRLEREFAADLEQFLQLGATTAQRERALRALDLISGHIDRWSAACMEDV